jgi:hypothetical protein
MVQGNPARPAFPCGPPALPLRAVEERAGEEMDAVQVSGWQNRRMEQELVELYGFHTEDVEEVREALESLFGVVFDRYASMFAGGYYFTELCTGHAALTLRENYGITEDEETGEEEEGLVEPEFPESGVILYVEWQTTAHSCREKGKALSGIGELLAEEK